MGQLPIKQKRSFAAFAIVIVAFISTVSYNMYANHSAISSLKSELSNKEQIIHDKDNLIRKHEGTLAEREALIDDQIAYITLQTQKLEEKNNLLEEDIKQIASLKADLAKLKELKQKEELQAKAEAAAAKEVSSRAVPISTTTSKTSGKLLQGWTLTFYSLDYASTGKRPGDKGFGLTASGTTVKEGRTVACPSSLKQGTRLYIEGIGTRVCEDTGSAIKGKKIDVYVANKTTRQLYRAPYGKRTNVKVTVLTSN